MTWIVATDVRDGARMAYPAASCCVSYDQTLLRRLREHATQEQHAQVELPEDLPDGLKAALHGAAENHRRSARVVARTLQVADAVIILVCGCTTPVRDLVYTDDFADLARLTGGRPPATESA